MAPPVRQPPSSMTGQCPVLAVRREWPTKRQQNPFDLVNLRGDQKKRFDRRE